MLARKLDTRTLSAVRARADFFFQEQVKRLGPLPVTALMADAALSCPPQIAPAVAPIAAKRKPRVRNPKR